MYLLQRERKTEREREREREEEKERPKAKTGMFLSRESNLLFTGRKKKKTTFLSIGGYARRRVKYITIKTRDSVTVDGYYKIHCRIRNRPEKFSICRST